MEWLPGLGRPLTWLAPGLAALLFAVLVAGPKPLVSHGAHAEMLGFMTLTNPAYASYFASMDHSPLNDFFGTKLGWTNESGSGSMILSTPQGMGN
jgi:hypothetical protein